jgi:hypothetical protein
LLAKPGPNFHKKRRRKDNYESNDNGYDTHQEVIPTSSERLLA